LAEVWARRDARQAGARDQGFLKNAVVSEDYWLFKVGQHVMTVDGVAGQVQAVEDGPSRVPSPTS
jgi:hypothetical protein